MNKQRKVFFYNSKLIIDPEIFSPRYETEQLIDLLREYIRFWITKPLPQVLEIGTGSGAMAIAWSKIFPHHQLFATDIRSQTLVCAKKNFVRQKVKCNLILSNLFEKINAKYDLIFANLPYISSNFPLDSEVKNQDPQIALYGGVDGLKWFRQFLQKVHLHLNPQFLIGLEIGFDQKDALQKMIKQFLPCSHFHFEKDYAGQDRFVFIYDKRT